MELRVLRYFLSVAREENISRAAEVLHITQPTLSRQLAQLEEELGVQLFERGSRRITLTEKGLLLRRRAEEIIAQVDKTQQELLEQDELVDGVVSIGCGEVLAVQLLAEILIAFKEKYPMVTYKLYTGNAEFISENVKRGILDIGMLLEPANISEYEYIRLNVKERWSVIMRADDVLATKKYVVAEDFIGKNVIFPWRIHVNSELKSWFGDCFDKVHLQMNCNMSTNASIMVRNNMGYSFHIEGARPYMDKSQLCSRPLYPELSTTNVLVWKKYQPFAKATTKFIEFLRQYLDDNKDSIRQRYYDYDK